MLGTKIAVYSHLWVNSEPLNAEVIAAYSYQGTDLYKTYFRVMFFIPVGLHLVNWKGSGCRIPFCAAKKPI